MALALQSGTTIDVDVDVDVERFTQGQYAGMEALNVKIKILLVDDDSTILTIASTLLRSFKYEVTAVKNSADALSTLRVRRGAYDLVVTDYHMPGMNGLELQKVVQAEYKLPVIVMSADERESIIMKTLECGGAFFIVKPIKAEDVKNIWQYAVAARKGKLATSVDKVGSINGYYESTEVEVEETDIVALGEAIDMEGGGEAVEPEEVDLMESMVEIKEMRTKRGSTKRKHKRKEEDINGDDGSESNNPKRSKVFWTTTLHNLFLQALNQIGFDKAVPKKILEYMGVPGLTRENVASHLQKYRIFLRRVADKTYTRSTSLDKSTQSSFAATRDSTINDILEDGLDYSKLTQLNLPVDFCKNLSSTSPGGLIRSSSSNSNGLSSIPSLDVTETGIGVNANSSGLQMISHQSDRNVPSTARLPFGNAVTRTMNSLSCTNRTYLQQFQGKWPQAPVAWVETTGNTNHGVEKQNTFPGMSGDSFLESFSPGKIAEDCIDSIDDGDFMNSSGRFMNFLTQGDPSVGLNDSENWTQVFPSLLTKDSAATAPGAASSASTTVDKTATAPKEDPSQHHAGDNEFFNLVFEQMRYSHQPLRDSGRDSMDVFLAANVQEHGNEDRQVVNPTDQQLSGQHIQTASTSKQQDVWTDHPSAEDQIWSQDFIDSLLDSSSPYLL